VRFQAKSGISTDHR